MLVAWWWWAWRRVVSGAQQQHDVLAACQPVTPAVRAALQSSLSMPQAGVTGVGPSLDPTVQLSSALCSAERACFGGGEQQQILAATGKPALHLASCHAVQLCPMLS